MSSASSFTDIHTHILPSIDDGAKDAALAAEMLIRQKNSGVERVFLTPHYNCTEQKLDDFLHNRETSLSCLKKLFDKNTMPEIRLGAEVRYSPSLLELDLAKLTLGGGDYLLVELSNNKYPVYIDKVLDKMNASGIIPVLAHVERCIYFRKQPERLCKLVQHGALAQVTASSLVDPQDKRFSAACLDNTVAQIVASDTHDLKSRPPCLADVLNRLTNHLAESAESYAHAIWNNEIRYVLKTGKIKKHIFFYR